jgi:hypothetical protein
MTVMRLVSALHVLLVLLALPVRTSGQEGTYHAPRFEIGAGGGLYVSALAPGAPLGVLAVWTTTNLTPRAGLELAGDGWAFSDRQDGAYYIRVRYDVLKPSTRPGVFVTAGGAGLFNRHPHPEQRLLNPDQSTVVVAAHTYRRLTRPLFGTFGGGLTHVIGRRAAIRGDVQLVVGIDRDFVAVLRMSAGVTIPIGSYRRGNPVGEAGVRAP